MITRLRRLVLTKLQVVFSISVAARKIMLDVDVDELEKLKYGYKGA